MRSRAGAISCVVLAFALSACGGSGSQSPAAGRHTAHTNPGSTPLSASSLPPRDANGYVEGPRTYTDDGVQVTLSSTQAANPIRSSKGVLTLGVVDRADVDQPFTSQSQINEVDMAQYTIRIGAAGLYFTSGSNGLITCSAEPVAAGAVWQAQTCDTPGAVINEIYDPATKVEAWSGYWNLSSIYQTTVGVLTGVYTPSHGVSRRGSSVSPTPAGGAALSYLTSSDKAILAQVQGPVLLPPAIPSGWLAPTITHDCVNPAQLPRATAAPTKACWEAFFSNYLTAPDMASVTGAEVFGGPADDFACPNSFLTPRASGCGVFTARGVPVNVSLGNDTSGLYYWQACGSGFGIDVTHAPGPTAGIHETESEAEAVINALMPVPSRGVGCTYHGSAASSVASGPAAGASVSVVRCPTEYGITPVPAERALPAHVGTSLTTSQATGLEFYGNNALLVLAPAGWQCSAQIGADGNPSMQVTKGQEGITAASTTAYMGALEACAFFADVQPEPTGASCSHRPAAETVSRLSDKAVEFDDPEGVQGPLAQALGVPPTNLSGGSLPTDGLLVFEPGSASGFLFTETCVLPSAEQSRCSVLLRDALTRAPQ
jgi:hypothetical protein